MQNTNWTLKNFAKDFKHLPKWLNFAKSGHTDYQGQKSFTASVPRSPKKCNRQMEECCCKHLRHSLQRSEVQIGAHHLLLTLTTLPLPLSLSVTYTHTGINFIPFYQHCYKFSMIGVVWTTVGRNDQHCAIPSLLLNQKLYRIGIIFVSLCKRPSVLLNVQAIR